MNKRARDAVLRVSDARTAMELFDIATSLMERVRGSPVTQARAQRIADLCTEARNKELAPMDKAVAMLGVCVDKEAGRG